MIETKGNEKAPSSDVLSAVTNEAESIASSQDALFQRSWEDAIE